MLGKHFRVSPLDNPKLSRHYTICNVMQPKIYAAYLNALRDDAFVSQDVLNEGVCDTVSFTIKNYATANGVSAKFYG
jgi:hypothetical protein